MENICIFVTSVTMKWTECQVSSPPPSRSSHGVCIIGDSLYMFGGEHEARSPVGGEMWGLDLRSDGGKMEWRALTTQGEAPSPRSVRITHYNINTLLESQGLVTVNALWARMFTFLEAARELLLMKSSLTTCTSLTRSRVPGPVLPCLAPRRVPGPITASCLTARVSMCSGAALRRGGWRTSTASTRSPGSGPSWRPGPWRGGAGPPWR